MKNCICAVVCLFMLTGAFTALGAADEQVAETITSHLLPNHIIDGQHPYTLAQRMRDYHVPGVGIAVIEDFEVVWTGFYGTTGSEAADPVTEETIFGMGSLSKGVCSAGVLNLARDGLVDIDAPVNGQMTSWQLPPHPWADVSPVTPALLMNHSGGLPIRRPNAFPADRMPTALQMVRGEDGTGLQPLAVTRQPGTGFEYSNGGYTTLEILTEDVSGAPYETVLQDRILAPLGLRRTTFANPLPDSRLPLAAFGHRPGGQPIRDQRLYVAHIAAGGLWSTAPEYARFVIEIQKAAAGRSDLILDQDQARRMISPGPATQYGLGVFLYEGNGSEPYFSHIGDGAGFVAGYAAHRDLGFGAVVTTNGAGGINLCREILRSVAYVYDWPGYLPAARRELAFAEAELDRLAGRYLANFDQVIALEKDGDRLRVRGEGLPGYTLYRVAPDTLVAVERKGEIRLDIQGDEPTLDLHLSDAIGRLGSEVTRAVRLADGLPTPLEQCLAAADEQAAFAPYLKIQAEQPDHPAVNESRFNRMGYQLLRESRTADAVRIFRLNTLLHPQSGNVHDSYGEALLTAGRNEEAAASYRRALELDPGNANAAEVLQRIASNPGH